VIPCDRRPENSERSVILCDRRLENSEWSVIPRDPRFENSEFSGERSPGTSLDSEFSSERSPCYIRISESRNPRFDRAVSHVRVTKIAVHRVGGNCEFSRARWVRCFENSEVSGDPT